METSRRGFFKAIAGAVFAAATTIYQPAKLLAPVPVELPSFEKFTFPIIRRVYPQLISQEIMQVQPMSGRIPYPSGIPAPEAQDYSAGVLSASRALTSSSLTCLQ